MTAREDDMHSASHDFHQLAFPFNMLFGMKMATIFDTAELLFEFAGESENSVYIRP